MITASRPAAPATRTRRSFEGAFAPPHVGENTRVARAVLRVRLVATAAAALATPLLPGDTGQKITYLALLGGLWLPWSIAMALVTGRRPGATTQAVGMTGDLLVVTVFQIAVPEVGAASLFGHVFLQAHYAYLGGLAGGVIYGVAATALTMGVWTLVPQALRPDWFVLAIFAALMIVMALLLDVATREQRGAAARLREAFGRERLAARRQRELDAMKDEFVAMVAHDLRSPMSVIAGYAEVLVRQWKRLDATERARYLETISRSTRDVSEMVEEVLQVSRLESGEVEYDLAPFDLAEMVHRAPEIASAGERDRIRVSAPEDLPKALGDEGRQWRVLGNLVTNALKFSEGPVEVRAEARDRELEVSVTDRGEGIDPQDMPRLFQKFSKLQQADSHRAKGSGLGLYICRVMVEAQGGRIWAESGPGAGATFRYTVPRADAAAD